MGSLTMTFHRATQADDEELRLFFNNRLLSGYYDYKLIRPHSFFDQYRLTTDDFVTYFLRDQGGNIQAITSILFKKAYINHQGQTIGYVTDLELFSNPRERSHETEEILSTIMKVREERDCQYFFSDLDYSKNRAYDKLWRRQVQNRWIPRYHLFGKFFLVVIYGRKFFAHKPLSGIKIEYAQKKDIEPICSYLQEKSVRRPLRYSMEPEELIRRCQKWPGFSLHHFFVARNVYGDIIGCMAPWDNSRVQQIVPTRYHGKSFQVYSTSKTLSLFSMARSLPSEGESLKVKYITHAAYDNPDIFYSLLIRAYEDCKNREVLIYPNYEGDYMTRPPRSFISFKIPHGFYCLLDKDTKPVSHLHPNPFKPAPDFQYSYF